MDDKKLEYLAREAGFMKRVFKLSAKEFLETTSFTNTPGCPSLEDYGANMLMNLGKRVSKQALDKRFKSHTKDFIGLLVDRLMHSQLYQFFNYTGSQNQFSEIRVMNSSQFGDLSADQGRNLHDCLFCTSFYEVPSVKTTG